MLVCRPVGSRTLSSRRYSLSEILGRKILLPVIRFVSGHFAKRERPAHARFILMDAADVLAVLPAEKITGRAAVRLLAILELYERQI